MGKILETVNVPEYLAEFIREVVSEYEWARVNFPSSEFSMTALTEEVGELAKALLEEPLENVRAEAKQVAVMAVRVALEGDPSLADFRERRGLGVWEAW